MKKLFLVSIFQLLLGLAFAQEHFNISGILKCDTALVKSTVVKLYQDSVMVAGVVSNEQGYFVLENIPQGKYQIEVVSYFYKPFSTEIRLADNYDFGVIALEKSLLLNEVVVQAEKEPIIVQPNGVTLNVESSFLKNLGSAADLIAYAPVVFFGNGSQFESGGLQILINGKPVNIPPERQDDFLKSISARSIEKIDIIDKPDASVEANKYGVVNITLTQTKGFSGDLRAKLFYHKTFFHAYEASLFFNSEKVRLYAMIECEIKRFLYESNGFEDRGFLQIQKSSNSNISATTPYLTLGGDYQINKKSSLGFLYSFYWENTRNIKGKRNSEKNIITGENLTADSLIKSELNDKHNYFEHTFTLSYNIETDTLGSSFSTSIDFASKNQKGQSAYNYSFWRDETAVVPTQVIDYKQQNYINGYVASFNAKYNKVFKNSSAFNVGAKFDYTHYNYGWNTFNLLNEDYVFDENGTRSLIFNEFIMALFTGYSFSYKKSYFSISARYEHNINLYKNNDDNYSTVQNWAILPNFLHSITINKNNKIYYSFAQRTYRPSYFYYMESTEYDPLSQSFGNSKLKPQNQYTFRLGYVFKNRYTAVLRLNRNENLFLQIPQITNNTVIYNIINGGNSNSVALILRAPVEIFEWWETSTSAALYYINRNFKNGLDKYISNNWEGDISHSSTFLLPKGFYIEIDYSYNSKSKSFFVEQSDIHDLGAGIGWSNDDFGVSFRVSDILNSVATNTTYNYFDKIISYNNHRQLTSRTFRVYFNYNFSVGKRNDNYDTLESGVEEQKGRM